MNLNSDKIPVIVIVGPTASGKTELSVNVALKFSGEIISADSMQIYKEFNISTAKPDEDKLKMVKHYLINEVSVKDDFSVYKYVSKAHVYARYIYKCGKTPIIVGGTGLYIDSFLNNVNFEGEKTSDDIKKDLYDEYKINKEKLYEDLKRIDPISAAKFHINDAKRIIRALEFYYSHGYTISKQEEKSRLIPSPYKATIIGLNFRDRKLLYNRINKRIDNMISTGLVNEVRNIMSNGLSKTAQCAIGYKEIVPYINGECSLDEAVHNLKINTRRYAKRQISWFKKNEDIKWIYMEDYSSFDDIIFKAESIIKDDETL